VQFNETKTKTKTKLPTSEEVQQIKAVTEPNPNWDKPEKFFLMLTEIPLVSNRLDCWSFMLHVPESLQSLNTSFSKILAACKVGLNGLSR
jgi:hypothetical protein